MDGWEFLASKQTMTMPLLFLVSSGSFPRHHLDSLKSPNSYVLLNNKTKRNNHRKKKKEKKKRKQFDVVLVCIIEFNPILEKFNANYGGI